MPYGRGISEALDYVLKLGKNMGFHVENVDNHIGYVEYGQGIEIIGVLGHLDVVPAGAAFTLPALLLMGLDVKIVTVFAIAVLGGVLGCLLMAPLRKFLIKDEDGKLPYPEGTACADVYPSLFGAGFLVDPRISAMSLAGSIIGWFVILPIIYFIGQYAPKEIKRTDRNVGNNVLVIATLIILAVIAFSP